LLEGPPAQMFIEYSRRNPKNSLALGSLGSISVALADTSEDGFQ
jgi:hypothetical protein